MWELGEAVSSQKKKNWWGEGKHQVMFWEGVQLLLAMCSGVAPVGACGDMWHWGSNLGLQQGKHTLISLFSSPQPLMSGTNVPENCAINLSKRVLSAIVLSS